MATMNDIEARVQSYAAARHKLAEAVQQLHDGIENLRRSNLPRIKRNLERASELHAEVVALIAASPELFVKPRSVVLHGIKVGYEKGKGAISFEDADQVVKLIGKKLPDQADVLIKTTSKPVKSALKQLTVQQLKSIGCTVEESGDQVLVRAVDSEVDKLVSALLKGAEAEAEELAEAQE
jgi:arsenate reductase-like glutaredoxin family protein